MQTNTSFGAGLVIAQIAIVNDSIVYCLFVNAQIRSLRRLVITFWTLKSHPQVFVFNVDIQGSFMGRRMVTLVALECSPFMSKRNMIL